MSSLSNRLLTAIGHVPPVLATRLKPVALPLRTVLFEAQQRPRFVHFLTSGIASSVINMSPGQAVEVGITGHEGMPEAAHLLGHAHAPTQCFMQVEGTALRMGFQDFQQEFLKHPDVAREILRYVQYEAFVSAQLCACARLHEVEERLSRWLLMVADRMESSSVVLTQEFLADMIGSRRSSVTLAAGSLQRAGLIDYRRGRIEIKDRPGLESAACECYAVVNQLYRSLSRPSDARDHADTGIPARGANDRDKHADGKPTS